MIEEVDRKLKSWVATVLDGVEVSLALPDRSMPGRGVSVYLVELADKPPLRNLKRPPLQFSLRYLVTTWAQKPEEAHALLGRLVLSALEMSEFTVEFPVAGLWTSLGTPPQPAFLLNVPLQKERPEPKVGIVQQVIVRTSPITSFHGVVLGPGDLPVAGAAVEIPDLRLVTTTDYKGHFLFPTVPSEPTAKVIEVRAKGRKLSITSDQNHPDDGAPIVVHLNLLEG
jgi:hypothetical protein